MPLCRASHPTRQVRGEGSSGPKRKRGGSGSEAEAEAEAEADSGAEESGDEPDQPDRSARLSDEAWGKLADAAVGVYRRLVLEESAPAEASSDEGWSECETESGEDDGSD